MDDSRIRINGGPWVTPRSFYKFDALMRILKLKPCSKRVERLQLFDKETDYALAEHSYPRWLDSK